MTIEQKPTEPIQNIKNDITTTPAQPAAEEDDWLAGIPACALDNPECEACQ